jgi:hypothetical protein
MNHKLTALLLTLVALFAFSAPAALAADGVYADGGSVQDVAPGANTISLTIENSAALRGVGFSYQLNNISAVSATVTGATVNIAELGQRRVLNGASEGVVYLAGRNGADDLAAGVHATAVDIAISVDGLTGDQVELVITGAAPCPGAPQFVGTDDAATGTPEPIETITLNVKAGVVTELDGVCPATGSTIVGGSVAAQVSASVNNGNFVSLALISSSKNGSPAIPANEPDTAYVGGELSDGTAMIFYWEPASGEEGTWEFCFESTNDVGDADTLCLSFTILAAGADAIYWQPKHFEFTSGGGPFGATLDLNFKTGADSTFGVVLPFYMYSKAGGAFITDPINVGDGTFSAAMSVFESQSDQNPTYANDAVSPDSMLGGLIDFGGPALNPGTYLSALSYSTSIADVEGVIEIDSVKLPPANQLGFNVNVGYNPDGGLTPSYGAGCYAVSIIRNICPDFVGCPVSSVGPVVFGDLVSIPGFTYNDPDNSPGPWTFSVVSADKISGPGAGSTSPANAPTFSGDTFEWQTSNADDQTDVGIWQFCVTVDDGSGSCGNGVRCCFEVEVIAETPYCLSFVDPGLSPVDEQPGDNVVNVIAGQIAEICINLEKEAGPQCMGGFDLLFCFDASMLTLLDVKPGAAILDWEFFTYRLIGNSKVRLVGIKDMNNSKPTQAPCNAVGPIACMKFKTTQDLTYACQKAPIRFCWMDCGDNSISSEDGNILYIVGADAGGIIDVNGGQIFDQEPDPFGYNATILHDCDWGVIKCEECVRPFVCFHNGGIRLLCPPEYDDRGDINLNGLANEIADAVLYSNYFIFGSSVLNANYQAQVAASDVNADGSPLTVADLVYLIRIITGDALPIADDYVGPKVASVVGSLDVISAQRGTEVTVSTKSDQDLGAALFVFKYENTEIKSVSALGRASSMDVAFTANNGELRVLVYNIKDRAKVAAGSGEILNVSTSGAGKVELESVEAASFMGGSLETSVTAKIIPTEFALRQNYPNPFNPSTSMALDLPNASDYRLTIYNIAGQVVKTYAGPSEAGTLTVTWDGTNSVGGKVASGVYFYRAEAGTFNATRKMVLMK